MDELDYAVDAALDLFALDPDACTLGQVELLFLFAFAWLVPLEQIEVLSILEDAGYFDDELEFF